ncbi:beta-lactamase-like protein [Sporodiniella umbellata]|nr:beta-lactamase-like protein [Sporodiniella umbellata]
MASELSSHQEIKIHKFPLSEEYPMQKYFGTIPESILMDDLTDQQVITVDPETHLRIVYTPGHAKDHCSFYLIEEGSIFTADCVLGHGTVTFEDLTEYMQSLHRIHQLKPKRLYPGHGDVVKNGIERVENYIAIRMAKEKQILDLMNDGLGWSAIELAENMAEPTKSYHEDVAAVLVRTAGLHLIKLHHDGKVELVERVKLESKYGEYLYDPHNIFSIVNHKWQLCINSKL